MIWRCVHSPVHLFACLSICLSNQIVDIKYVCAFSISVSMHFDCNRENDIYRKRARENVIKNSYLIYRQQLQFCSFIFIFSIIQIFLDALLPFALSISRCDCCCHSPSIFKVKFLLFLCDRCSLRGFIM